MMSNFSGMPKASSGLGIFGITYLAGQVPAFPELTKSHPKGSSIVCFLLSSACMSRVFKKLQGDQCARETEWSGSERK